MSERKRKRKRRRRPRAGPQPNPRATPVAPGQGEPVAGEPAVGAGELSATPPQPSSADDVVRAAARRSPDGPPPPPWGSWPLSEILVVVAILLLVGGFFVAPPRGAVMLGTGLVLGSLAGLELSLREHFSGYRSHTLVLAGAVGIAVLAGLLIGAKLSPAPAAAGGALAAGAAAYLFSRAFRRRSGGAAFRIRP